MPKILIMEDSVEQASALREWLEISGHDVTVTHSTEDALENLEPPATYDLLVTDIFAPRDENTQIERGLTLIDKVRCSDDDRLKVIPIISISGVRFPRSHSYSFDDPQAFGSNVHFAKPLDLNRLTNTIDELLSAA